MLPRPHVLCYDKHGFIPWSQSTRLSREGALGPLSFISERQYIEQSTDNQQDQSAVNRTELQHTELRERFPILFHSDEEVRNMLLLTDINQDNWGKRPLTKLTRDISDELDELYKS